MIAAGAKALDNEMSLALVETNELIGFDSSAVAEKVYAAMRATEQPDQRSSTEIAKQTSPTILERRELASANVTLYQNVKKPNHYVFVELLETIDGPRERISRHLVTASPEIAVAELERLRNREPLGDNGREPHNIGMHNAQK